MEKNSEVWHKYFVYLPNEDKNQLKLQLRADAFLMRNKFSPDKLADNMGILRTFVPSAIINYLDIEMFLKILGDKVPYDSETLINVFHYLVKTDRDFNMDDYIKYFENPETKINFDEPYYLKMMQKIINLISKKHFKAGEYFDYLVLNNVSTLDKLITRLNWIKYLQKENLDFNAEELDNLFK